MKEITFFFVFVFFSLFTGKGENLLLYCTPRENHRKNVANGLTMTHIANKGDFGLFFLHPINHSLSLSMYSKQSLNLNQKGQSTS